LDIEEGRVLGEQVIHPRDEEVFVMESVACFGWVDEESGWSEGVEWEGCGNEVSGGSYEDEGVWRMSG